MLLKVIIILKTHYIKCYVVRVLNPPKDVILVIGCHPEKRTGYAKTIVMIARHQVYAQSDHLIHSGGHRM